MALIKSISGIRGTIGGRPGTGLSPLDVVKYTAAYAEWILRTENKKEALIITGRDARTSGKMVNKLMTGTLTAMGINVLALQTVIDDISLADMFRGVMPFLVAMILCVVILIVFPDIVLFLPRLFEK